MQEPVADSAMKQGPPSPDTNGVSAASSNKVLSFGTDLLLAASPSQWTLTH